MMPQIDVVPVMRKAPGRCLCCNTTPADSHGNPKKAIDLNVDVDWGQNAYLCDECVSVICDLWGRVDEDEHNALLTKFKELNGDHQRLRKRFRELRDNSLKMAEGKKAERKLKKRKKAKS